MCDSIMRFIIPGIFTGMLVCFQCLFTPQNSYVEISMFNVLILEGWAFGVCLSYEVRALMSGISTPEISWAPLPLQPSEDTVYKPQ